MQSRTKETAFDGQRRSIRLPGYDYSQQGVYFVTVCCERKTCLFGRIHADQMICNEAGKMVRIQWLSLPNRFPGLRLDECVVMPNHFHALLILDAKSQTVGQIVGAWKSLTTNCYIDGVRAAGWPPFPRRLWQRNYWEHIVRSDEALVNVRDYITSNPAHWEKDGERP
jgi:putative transposase